jgi:arsenate reductase-like glutaredoxin family protein
VILYGLPTCPDCSRALKTLSAVGHEVTFRDVRAEPLTEAERNMLLREFGSTLIDRNTAAFRGLSVFIREAEADVQLKYNPALMARPILQDGESFTKGWDPKAQAVWT